jgi:hypothetical protein
LHEGLPDGFALDSLFWDLTTEAYPSTARYVNPPATAAAVTTVMPGW